jgi:hypothetical protein
VEVPALSVDYRNGFLPFGSYVFSVEGHGFSASGCDFYLYRGISYPEAKQPKQEGTFRVKNDAKFLVEKTAQAWRKLGGTAELKKRPQCFSVRRKRGRLGFAVCVASGDWAITKSPISF